MNDPKKKAFETRIAIVLMIIFIASLVRSNIKQSATIPTEQIITIEQFNLTEDKKKLLAIETESIVEYRGEPVRDPMRIPPDVIRLLRPKEPVTTQRGEPVRLDEPPKHSLDGIIYDNTAMGKTAIVSGKVVSENEMFGESKVVEIRKDSVLLNWRGRDIELKR